MYGLDLAPVGDILFHVKLPIDLTSQGSWPLARIVGISGISGGLNSLK